MYMTLDPPPPQVPTTTLMLYVRQDVIGTAKAYSLGAMKWWWKFSVSSHPVCTWPSVYQAEGSQCTRSRALTVRGPCSFEDNRAKWEFCAAYSLQTERSKNLLSKGGTMYLSWWRSRRQWWWTHAVSPIYWNVDTKFIHTYIYLHTYAFDSHDQLLWCWRTIYCNPLILRCPPWHWCYT